MWTALLCLTPSMSTSTVVMGPTSQVKKAGVMRALSSAPHLAHKTSIFRRVFRDAVRSACHRGKLLYGSKLRHMRMLSMCSCARPPNRIMCVTCMLHLQNHAVMVVSASDARRGLKIGIA